MGKLCNTTQTYRILVILCLVSLPSCIGLRASSIVLRYGDVPYVMDHSCIGRVLQMLEIKVISFVKQHKTYNDSKYTNYTYTYRFADDQYPKTMEVSIVNASFSTIRHFVRTPESLLWSGNDSKKLNKDNEIMLEVERKVTEVCKLPHTQNSPFFKQRFPAKL